MLILFVGFGVPVGLMVLKGKLGLGYVRPKWIGYMGVSGNYLAFNDDRLSVGKHSRKTHHYRRFYLVDLSAGKLIARTPIKGMLNSVELADNQQILMKASEEQRYFSLKGSQPTTQPSKVALEDLPELKSGIYKKGYNAQTDQIWVINKEGKKYFYNPQTHAQEPQGKRKPHNQAKLFRLYKSVRNTKTNCGLSFYRPRNRRHSSGNEVRKPLYVGNHTTKEHFIRGEVTYCLPRQNVGIVTSYKTTDKEKKIITAVNLKTGEVWWQKNCKALGVDEDNAYLGYIIPVSPTESVWFLGVYLLRIETQTGKILWKMRV
jgi:hypothetical protein